MATNLVHASRYSNIWANHDFTVICDELSKTAMEELKSVRYRIQRRSSWKNLSLEVIVSADLLCGKSNIWRAWSDLDEYQKVKPKAN